MGRCPENSLVDPRASLEFLENQPLTEKGRKVQDPVQMRPQRVSIANLRVGNRNHQLKIVTQLLTSMLTDTCPL